MRVRWPALVLLVLATTCGGTAEPRPQWTVAVTTDAPVPRFGDRLFIEILDEAGNSLPDCSTCQRQLGADDPERWPISFGIEASSSKLRVRVRLFRVALLGANGTPSGRAMIDRSVTLPEASGNLHVAIELAMSCFGIPSDIPNKQTCAPDTGALAPEREAPRLDPATVRAPGSWPAAGSTPCNGTTRDEMVCIPGGAFLLGDPTASGAGAFDAPTTPEHVVVLSPFRIDKDELTVREYLALRAQHPELSEPSKRGTKIDQGDMCTYGGADPALPLSCVTRSLATAICAAQGKRLPTEAEWEYAAGNTTRESTYPWGTDDDVCNHAVLGRGFTGPTLCRVATQGTTLPPGPAPGGAALDVTMLGARNLAGSLSEWVEDTFVPYAGGCWSAASQPLVDPKCKAGSSFGTARGGNWYELPLGARVVFRRPVDPELPSATIGVRCASD